MKSTDRDVIDETIRFWGKRAGVELSREDGREIIENISGFFRVLDEWSRSSQTGEEGTAM